MANMAVSRIKREFKEVMKSEEIALCSIKIELVNDSWTDLKGEIAGPTDTPYEGGRFLLEIRVPETYPFNPPKVRFITKIWHPNISSVTGAICLDILKDNWQTCQEAWGVLSGLLQKYLNKKEEETIPHLLCHYPALTLLSGRHLGSQSFNVLTELRAAAMTLRTVLLSLQALLAAAEPDDPQDAVVANQYKENYALFLLTARHWTNVYAGGPYKFPECDAKIQRLKDMGINEHEARAVLSKENWDLEKATESLFS